MEKDHHS